jgi:hypothetical protein
MSTPFNLAESPDFSLYSDMHKDAYGFRPRNPDFFPKTLEEYQQELTYLEGLICEQIKEDRIRHAAALKTWKARIRKTASDHSVSLVTAIRWEMDAEGVYHEYLGDYDIDHYFWICGIEYRLTYRFNKWLRKALRVN